MAVPMSWKLGELAVRFGCTLKGDPDVVLTRVAPLETAGPDELSFLANARHRRYLEQTRAGALVIDPALADACPVPALLTNNPHACFARIAALLHPLPPARIGVHERATVDGGARIAASASVGAGACIAAEATVGEHAVIGPGCVLMTGAVIGAHSRLWANVVIYPRVRIGERCILHAGAVIGGDGFGFAPDNGEWLKVPQVGSVIIGDDVEIGANTAIDRGAIGDTVIEDGVKLDNLIQIGHNVRIGAHTAIAAGVGVAGSTEIGKRCMIAGMVGITGHIRICDDVVVTGKSTVTNSVTKPGVYSSALPLEEAGMFRRNAARFKRLDQIARAVRALSGDKSPTLQKSMGDEE
jgi:UDP-3-O-[3-hydroxymyristoyl] glucosamine N-acyltransferase